MRAVPVATPEPAASPPATLARLASDWELPTPPADVALPGIAATAADDVADEGLAFDWAGEVVRVVGTVTHRYLERLADDGLAGWDRARIQGERGRIELLLAEGVATFVEIGPGDTLLSFMKRIHRKSKRVKPELFD